MMRRFVSLIFCVSVLTVLMVSQRPTKNLATVVAQDGLPPTSAQPSSAPVFIIAPYLQYPTLNSISILWQTDLPGTSAVEFEEESLALSMQVDPKKPTPLKLRGRMQRDDVVALHEIKLTDLKPQTKYYYRVETATPGNGTLRSDVLTFSTAVEPGAAFSFAVIGDTQKNPVMTEKVARHMWARRPNIVLHVGDVVDNGPDRHEWIYELFRPMSEMLSRVAIFPAIGNHEKDHANYYKHFALPDPEYCYRFSYGNADFFSIDTNKKVGPTSAQYRWLDQELARSQARWKFAYHHHPVYTSDDDDYGNTWKGQISTQGDLNARSLVALYEKHNVDVVFNGHIHVYERSWPIRGGKVDAKRGIHYITSGGGGGKLENFAPTPTWFKAETRVDYHFCYVAIHGDRLTFKAFDHDGRLFDFLDIQK